MNITYYDGSTSKTYSDTAPEYLMARACYADDLEEVRRILRKHPKVDIDACVYNSKTRGNGTPLVLTGCVKIARLLIKHGANSQHPCRVGGSQTILPIDSARKELKKFPVKSDPQKKKKAEELLRYFEKLEKEELEKEELRERRKPFRVNFIDL